MSAEILLDAEYPADSSQLQHVREQVRKILMGYHCSADYINAVVLAVDEACANVIRHAYAVDQSGNMRLQIEKDEQTFLFRMIDYAPTADKSKIKSRSLDEIKPGGLGFHLMNTIMDTVVLLDPPGGNGNILEMTKHLETGES